MKRKRKQKKHNKALSLESYTEPEGPRSFVIHHGKIGTSLKILISDFRNIMKPNTAEKLVARRRNSVKDFVAMAGPFKVTHLLVFSQTDSGVNLKISRLPQGPTIYFRVIDYSLRKDVNPNQKSQVASSKHSLYAPCFMTNLQHSEGEKHLQLCSQMFLNMFPTISPTNVKTASIKRCCLVHYDDKEDVFDLRHYAIKFRPAGVSKATRKILGAKIPDLGRFGEMADFVEKADLLSGSEAEDDPSKEVTIRKKRKDGEVTRQQSVVKLSELGPRLTLKLIKIEDGVSEGSILYHALHQMSDEEKLKIEEKRAQQLSLKRARQKQQEKNIELKKKKKEDHRQRCLQGMGIDAASSSKRKSIDEEAKDDSDVDDDAQYFKEEVGEEPDEDLFKKKPKVDRPSHHKFQRYKKKKKTY